jgi:hypothetical protein
MFRFAAIFPVISLSCSPPPAKPYGHQPDAQVINGDAHAVPDDGAHVVTPDAPPSTMPCKAANVIHGDGHHNSGMDCMSSCHFHGFSVAGSLYLADGTTPAKDATVTIVDANHGSQDLIVGTNGNFFSYFPVAYPITVTSSLCPSIQTMVSQPTAGGCNATGCHEPGGVQGTAHL